jgi:hypothetical protein
VTTPSLDKAGVPITDLGVDTPTADVRDELVYRNQESGVPISESWCTDERIQPPDTPVGRVVGNSVEGQEIQGLSDEEVRAHATVDFSGLGRDNRRSDVVEYQPTPTFAPKVFDSTARPVNSSPSSPNLAFEETSPDRVVFDVRPTPPPTCPACRSRRVIAFGPDWRCQSCGKFFEIAA